LGSVFGFVVVFRVARIFPEPDQQLGGFVEFVFVLDPNGPAFVFLELELIVNTLYV